MRRVLPVSGSCGPGYPPRRAEQVPDAGRRRFLRQLAVGAGAAAVGLPRLAHGQSAPVDFTVLDRHADLDAPGQARADAPELREEQAPRAEPEPAPAEPPAPGEAGEELAYIEENRALWVEPGYLVLVRLLRPHDDAAAVAALEGSADAVQAFLATRVNSVDDLHDLARLHAVETELLALLRAQLAPAQVAVLHLDHDCATVCSGLGGSTVPPDRVPLRGEAPPIGWE